MHEKESGAYLLLELLELLVLVLAVLFNLLLSLVLRVFYSLGAVCERKLEKGTRPIPEGVGQRTFSCCESIREKFLGPGSKE